MRAGGSIAGDSLRKQTMSKSFHKFWIRWITALIVAGFGPVFFLGTLPATDELPRFALDLLSWPVDGAQTYEGSSMRFLSALTGGFLFGWGVLIWQLSGTLYDLASELVRKAILSGLVAWFVLDSAGSWLSGHAPNVFFNVLVLLIAAGPLWRPAMEDRPT